MTQIEIIKQKLSESNEVSRNWAISKYISRLASRIKDLETEGYKFRTERRKGDYVYIWLKGQLELF